MDEMTYRIEENECHLTLITKGNGNEGICKRMRKEYIKDGCKQDFIKNWEAEMKEYGYKPCQ